MQLRTLPKKEYSIFYIIGIWLTYLGVVFFVEPVHKDFIGMISLFILHIAAIIYCWDLFKKSTDKNKFIFGLFLGKCSRG